jgi:hypothetical protein
MLLGLFRDCLLLTWSSLRENAHRQIDGESFPPAAAGKPVFRFPF